jgi:ABC-type transporter Mla subunit MlaD
MIKELNKSTKTLNSVEDLANAQQILSEYIDKLQQIQIKLENLSVTLDYSDYKNKVALTLTELINYNVQVKSYYSQLSIALSKDLPDEVTKFIQALKNINSGYLVSANESKTKVNSMWTKIKEDDYQFNLKSLEERNKIDSTYEELLTKYKIT